MSTHKKWRKKLNSNFFCAQLQRRRTKYCLLFLRVCCSCLGSKCNPWGVGWTGFARDPVGCVCVCVCTVENRLELTEVMTVGVPQPTVCKPARVRKRRDDDETDILYWTTARRFKIKIMLHFFIQFLDFTSPKRSNTNHERTVFSFTPPPSPQTTTNTPLLNQFD